MKLDASEFTFDADRTPSILGAVAAALARYATAEEATYAFVGSDGNPVKLLVATGVGVLDLSVSHPTMGETEVSGPLTRWQDVPKVDSVVRAKSDSAGNADSHVSAKVCGVELDSRGRNRPMFDDFLTAVLQHTRGA